MVKRSVQALSRSIELVLVRCRLHTHTRLDSRALHVSYCRPALTKHTASLALLNSSAHVTLRFVRRLETAMADVQTANAFLAQTIKSLNRFVSSTTNATRVDELVQLLTKTIQVRSLRREDTIIQRAGHSRCPLFPYRTRTRSSTASPPPAAVGPCHLRQMVRINSLLSPHSAGTRLSPAHTLED